MRKALHSSLLIAIALNLAAGCPNSVTTGGMGTDVTTGGTTGGTGTNGGGSTGGTVITTDNDRILELVNSERTSRGLTALTRNTLLDIAATAHADDMSAGAFFSHTGSDGGSVSGRATAAGYPWTTIGENIAQGDLSPEAVMDLWMNSDGHRANILNATFTELGVGINDSGSTLWVQVFGRQ